LPSGEAYSLYSREWRAGLKPGRAGHEQEWERILLVDRVRVWFTVTFLAGSSGAAFEGGASNGHGSGGGWHAAALVLAVLLDLGSNGGGSKEVRRRRKGAEA